MSDNVMQHSFSAGELAPSLLSRTDLQKYRSGAATMRNFFVDYRSGASTRPGFEFIGYTADQSGNKVRLIPYQLSAEATFVIEFGWGYCRFITNGGYVLDNAFSVVAVTNTSPVQITATGHNYSVGQTIFVTGTGVPQLDGRYLNISNVVGDVLTLSDPTGIPVSGSGWPAPTATGTSQRVYTIGSPYTAADLPLLKFFQLGNVMTICHPAHPQTTLTATAYNNWAFATLTFGTSIGTPVPYTLGATAGGTSHFAYVVTAIDKDNQESLPSAVFYLDNVVNISATAGSLYIIWYPVTGAVSYNVYKAEASFAGPIPVGAAFGYVGSVDAPGQMFTDSNIQPDFSQTPPKVFNPFAGTNYPGCGCYFQQRAYYAGSYSFPTTFWASQPGVYTNFNSSDPIIDSDSIQGTLVSLQINAIKNMLPMPGGLILLTTAGAWQLSSGSGGMATTAAVTPTNATATPQAYQGGANDMPPIVINYDILYVQSKGSIVRDLTFNIYANIYTGADISIMSNHFFFDHTLTEWGWAEEHYKVVWCVRDDGILLALTYLKEQDMVAWSRHDTLGLFKSVCAVRESDHDAVYVVVQRQIGGRNVQMVERLAQRMFTYGSDSVFCVDAGVRSPQYYPSAKLTATNCTGPTQLIVDSPQWQPSSVGWVVRAGGGIANITGYISSTVVNATWIQDPYLIVKEQGAPIFVPQISGKWSTAKPATVFYGLDHLEGQTVSVVADGIVQAPMVVQNGKITLAYPASNVSAGLGYVCQLQTMYLDTGEPTIQGKRKTIPAVTIRARETRGVKAGRTWDRVTPVKQFNPSIQLGRPIPLMTTDAFFNLDPYYDPYGQLCMQVDDPVPATILGIIPEVVIGDTSGSPGKTAK